jgi:lysophospholipase L1-like esterase
MKYIYIIGAAAILFSACKPNIHIDPKPTAGRADFTNYLAIGNSLTAGYTDGSLTLTGQLNSYPQRLFEQFSIIPVHGAVGPFIQPIVRGDNGYPMPKLVLGLKYSFCNPAESSLAPVRLTGSLDTNGDYHYNATVNNGQINNIGVPGIRAVDYRVPGYALFAQAGGAPYAFRFYNSLAATFSPNDELLFQVHNLHPTFFTMWLGSNDVLGYALKGGQGNDASTATPIFPYFYNTSDISPLSAFDSSYDLALNSAISTGASGALINIPDITSIPYFTTVPADGLVIDRQTYADSLVNLYLSMGIRTVFTPGRNFFMVRDHAGLIRQAVPGELILLDIPQDSIKCAGWGSATSRFKASPIPSNLVLTTDEIQFIRTATQNYNAYIQLEAKLHALAYVDINALFTTLSSGITYNGVTYNTEFVTGGAISLDGIHPTARGYALIANEIIRTINSFYGANVTTTDVNKYKGVTFP